MMSGWWFIHPLRMELLNTSRNVRFKLAVGTKVRLVTLFRALLYALGGALLLTGCTIGAIKTAITKNDPLVAKEELVKSWRSIDPEALLVLNLEPGPVVIQLSSNVAPRHVDRVRGLVRDGFYDGLIFNRVIDGFVAQVGAATSQQRSPFATEPLGAEFQLKTSAVRDLAVIQQGDGYAPIVGYAGGLPIGLDGDCEWAWHVHCAGAVAMVRGNSPDSATAYFYIGSQPLRYLDRNLTVFGYVIDGMEHIQTLQRTNRASLDDALLQRNLIKTAEIASDIQPQSRPAYEIMRAGTSSYAEFLQRRENRAGEFFVHQFDYADICSIVLPIRKVAKEREYPE